jgi:hypothetical protein
MKTITNIINPALALFAFAYLSLSLTAHAVTPEADRGDANANMAEKKQKIARLRNEMIALDASLITAMSQAETSIANDVELLHASIVAAQRETVDTAAAYREAKSLIADLDNLRQHAITDLTLPSDYTPPDVPATALAGASTDPRSVLASTYEHAAGFEHLFADLKAESLDIQKRAERVEFNREPGTGPLLAAAAAWNALAEELSSAASSYSQVTQGLEGVWNPTQSAINGMARNLTFP